LISLIAILLPASEVFCFSSYNHQNAHYYTVKSRRKISLLSAKKTKTFSESSNVATKAKDSSNDLSNRTFSERIKHNIDNDSEPQSSKTIVKKKKDKKKKKKKRAPNFRMEVYIFLNRPRVEVLSVMAVLFTCFAVAIDTLDIGAEAHANIDRLTNIFNVIFAIDFFVRWYAAGNFKSLYLTKPSVIIDIFVILVPLFLSTVMPTLESTLGTHSMPNIIQELQFDSSGVQNLLLLRILRIRRVLTDINTFGRFQKALGMKRNTVKPYQLQLSRVLLSIFTLLSITAGLVYTTEHEVNPAIPDYFAALYFALTTLTTVGFGDISPITSEGRFVVCLSILAGVAVIPAQAANFVEALLEYQEDRKKGGPRVIIRAEKSNKKNVSSGALKEAASVIEVSKKTTVEVKVDEVKGKDVYVGWLGRCCLECQCTDHRENAKYCWSCGSEI